MKNNRMIHQTYSRIYAACRKHIDIIGIRALFLIIAIILVLSSNILKGLTPVPIVHGGNVIIYVLFASIIIFDRNFFKEKRLRVFAIIILLFIISGSIGRLIYGGKLVQYLWSVRNYCRFFFLIIDCYVLLNDRHVKYLIGLFDCIIVMHILITLVQFFAMGIDWDFLNGFFGNETGAGVGLNVLLIVNTCVRLIQYHKKRIGTMVLLFHIAWMCLNAAMAEIKFFVIELGILILIYAIFMHDVKRLAVIIPVAILLMVISARIMYYMFPFFGGFYSLDIIHTLYASGGLHYHLDPESIGRMNQISGMMPHIREFANAKGNSAMLNPYIFGLGLGNGEYALSIPMFNSDFYLQYMHTWYYDFTASFVFVETGFVGLAIYSSIFVYMLCNHLFCLRSIDNESRCLGIMMSVLSIVLIVYDVSLRNNFGYMIWIMLAVPYIMSKGSKNVQTCCVNNNSNL